MNLEEAEEALEGYGYPSEPLEYRVSDLVTDLFIIVREVEGVDALDGVLRRVQRDTEAEPESARDYYQLAMMFERRGLTSMATKCYERAGDLT